MKKDYIYITAQKKGGKKNDKSALCCINVVAVEATFKETCYSHFLVQSYGNHTSMGNTLILLDCR